MGSLYYPIDQRLVENDIHQATICYANENDDGWLFAHSDLDSLHDYELELESALVAIFAASIDVAQIKVNEATNDAIRIDAVRKHAQLVYFRDDVKTELIDRWCHSLHVSWLEQNPHHAHLHEPIRRAIDIVMTRWRANQPKNWSDVSGRVSDIRTELRSLYKYETRWAKAARIASEAAQNRS